MSPVEFQSFLEMGDVNLALSPFAGVEKSLRQKTPNSVRGRKSIKEIQATVAKGNNNRHKRQGPPTGNSKKVSLLKSKKTPRGSYKSSVQKPP